MFHLINTKLASTHKLSHSLSLGSFFFSFLFSLSHTHTHKLSVSEWQLALRLSWSAPLIESWRQTGLVQLCLLAVSVCRSPAEPALNPLAPNRERGRDCEERGRGKLKQWTNRTKAGMWQTGKETCLSDLHVHLAGRNLTWWKVVTELLLCNWSVSFHQRCCQPVLIAKPMSCCMTVWCTLIMIKRSSFICPQVLFCYIEYPSIENAQSAHRYCRAGLSSWHCLFFSREMTLSAWLASDIAVWRGAVAAEVLMRYKIRVCGQIRQ